LKAAVQKGISFLLLVALLYCFSSKVPQYISDIGLYYILSGFLLIVILVIFLKLYRRKSKNEESSVRPSQKVVVVFILLFFLFMLPIVYNSRGSDDALQDKEYSVLSSNQSMVVLRVYGDNAICVSWYREGNQSYIAENQSFVILPLENITLTPQEIGPLHLK